MRRNISITIAALLLITAAIFADDHERKGKIVRIDSDARLIVVQAEHGDQWDIYWTETTKLEDGLTIGELRPGDKIEVSFVEREGKNWATEIEREKKAER